MTQKQKLALKLKERKDKLAELAGLESLTDEQRTEMDKTVLEVRDVDSQLTALLLAEPDPPDVRHTNTAEGREVRNLIERADVGRIAAAVIEQRGHLDGREKELQDHYKLNWNQVPLACLEQRAVTPSPTNVQQAQQEPIPAVFPMSASSWLGVDMPTVPVGESVYPVLETNTDAADYDKAAVVTEPAASYGAEVLSPRRISASFRYAREDAAKFQGMDASLRMNLSDALQSGLDKYILTKTDLGLLEFGTDPTAATGVETFARYRAAIYGSVDGRYAMESGGVRLLVGPKTYEHMSTIYRSNTADDSALDSLMRISGGVRVSAHVAAPASSIQQAVTARGMGLRHAVAPLWAGIDLIFDNVTGAAKGEIVLTAIMLMNFKVIRADGFKRLAFRLA